VKSVSSNSLERLSGVEIKSMQQVGSLQVFGLKWSAEDGLDYETLDEALLDKVLEFTEINEGGQVPAIKVENKSGRMVFLMAGELLVGCRQDRVLNTAWWSQSKLKCLSP
jgi:ARG/rhodanese/phosphatase superfamily protein